MARPRKYNADYFPHDNDMRNDPKILALRNNFGNEGYAIWCFVLELLSRENNFKIKIKNETEWEVFSGDFRISVELAKKIMGFCSRNGLLQVKNGVFECKNLVTRLAPMLEKREFLRQKYGSTLVSAPETGVSTTEMPQSKVKESNNKRYGDFQKNPPTHLETPMNLEELNDGDVSYTSEDAPKKYKGRGKEMARLARYYMGITGKTGNVLRFYPIIKELFELAEKTLPKEKCEAEIKARIEIAHKHFESLDIQGWGLGKVAENWDIILNKWSV